MAWIVEPRLCHCGFNHAGRNRVDSNSLARIFERSCLPQTVESSVINVSERYGRRKNARVIKCAMQSAISLNCCRDQIFTMPSSLTSVLTKIASPSSRLIFSTVSDPAGSTSPITTFAPLCAKSSAVARPIPRLPPVTSATLPEKSKVFADTFRISSSRQS